MKNRSLLIVLGILLLPGLGMILASTIALFFLWVTPQPKFPPDDVPAGFVIPDHNEKPKPFLREDWTEYEKLAETQTTLTFESPRAPLPEETQDWMKLLNQLRKTNDDGNVDRAYVCFDTPRFYADRIRMWKKLYPQAQLSDEQKSEWEDQFYHHTMRFDFNNIKNRWKSFSIVRVIPTKDVKNAIVTVRHTPAEGSTPGLRQWWITRTEHGWKILDFTDTKYFLWYRTSFDDGKLNEQANFFIAEEEFAELITPLCRAIQFATMNAKDPLNRILSRIEEAPDHRPLTAWLKYCEGYRYQTQNEHAQALQHYDDAIRNDPLWPLPYVARSELRRQLGRLNESLEDVHRCTELVGPWPNAVAQEVKVLRQLGKTAEAKAALQTAMATYPDHPELMKLANPSR